ncbi:ABC transporter permease/M1 family aminopeptidase [Gabonibacter chumensis]|uniref:ABC transporter permease/M1 family aminopeptidase n=1 Tax=Gabonibacter chumensis TaxID=2972474 RepID=UPI002573C63C|nr:ABC transporter permease [Gabonibacter chumensis]MCR9011770.1 ABC transporter permease [Gabonibacter chumensis]
MNFKDINLVVRYERKIITRNFVFILLAFLLVAGILGFHVFAHSDWRITSYAFRSDIPSAIPYTNAYLFCVFQFFIAIFLAGDFIRREPLKNTNEALLTRPVGNREYVLGKGLAMAISLVMLDVVLIILTGMLHYLATDAVFSPLLYLFYFFTLTLPAILFTTALIICVKMFVRSQVLALLLLLFYWWASLTLIPFFAHGIADFTASRVPNIFSPLAGHPGMGSYLLQRLVFFCIAWGLFAFSVLGFRRFSARWKYAGLVIAACFGVGVLTGLIYLFPFERQSELREHYRSVYRNHDNAAKVNTVEHEITFHQAGECLSSSSRLLIENRNVTAIDTVLFYLNPGLELSSLIIDGKALSFDREDQVIIVPFRMEPGRSSLVTMRYSGKLYANICYPEIGDKEFNTMDFNNMLCLGHRFFFLTDDFSLLTPESMWYPTTIPVVNIGFPWISRRDYTSYKLKMVNPTHKTILSQGEMSVKGDTTCFDNEQKLFGITLVAGDMDKEQFRDSEFLSEYYYPEGEVPCQGAFLASEEGKRQSVEKIKFGFITYYGYPYKKVALVEVPVSFHTFIRPWKEGTDYIHPEVFLVPERRTSRLTDFKDLLEKMIQSNIAKLSGKDERIAMIKSTPLADVEANIIEANFNMRYVGPVREFFSWLPFVKKDKKRNSSTEDSWNKYEYSFLGKEGTLLLSSSRYPMINSIFKVMKPDKLSTGTGSIWYKMEKELEAIEYLSVNSLEQAFQPGKEIPEMKNIVAVKGRDLWKRLQHLTGDSLLRVVDDFRERYAYQEVDFDVFCDELNRRFAINVYPVLNAWYTSKGVPAFVVRDVEINEDREKKQATIYFKVWNKSNLEGIVSVNYIHSPLFGPEEEGTLKSITIAPQACLEVALVSPLKGSLSRFWVSTGFSRNVPEQFVVRNPGKVWVDRDTIREIDTTYFTPPANEIIVDNEDEGFVIHEERSSYFERSSKDKKYSLYPRNKSEWRWTLFVSNHAYGDVMRSFYSKCSGSGKSRVEWNATIKEAGTYELFIKCVTTGGTSFVLDGGPTVEYSFFHDSVEDKIFFTPPKNGTAFTVKLHRAGEGEEEIKFDLGKGDVDAEFTKGWVFSGKYGLSPGDVKVVLQDKGLQLGEVLNADAVKWVKVK